jgi:uncharacterized protein with GYD domain
MPLYILATKLQDPNLVENREERGRKWVKLVREKVPDIKWIAHYAILGPYDFIDIFEVNNEQNALKVSLVSRSAGASKAESWTAIPYAEFLELVEDLK